MPYHSELFEDLSEGVESWEGHCGDKEDDGFYVGRLGDVIWER